MTRRLRGAIVIAAVAAVGAAAAAQSAETFTATANVKKGGVSATAPVKVTVTRYADDGERAAVVKAVRAGGAASLQKLLSAARDAGTIQLGDVSTPVKFASQRPTADGRLVTVVTAKPMLALGGGVPQAKSVAGFDVAIAMFEVKNGNAGVGDLSPAAKVAIDDGGALVIEDYGATVVWLNSIARAK